MLEIFQTGAHYHLIHAVALVAFGIWAQQAGATASSWTGWMFVAGTLLFSGSLYALAISGVRALGAITPLGGLSFMAGWLIWAVVSLRGNS